MARKKTLGSRHLQIHLYIGDIERIQADPNWHDKIRELLHEYASNLDDVSETPSTAHNHRSIASRFR